MGTLITCGGTRTLALPKSDGPGWSYRTCPGCAACVRRLPTPPTPQSVARSLARLPQVEDEPW